MDVNSVSAPFRYPGDPVYVERALDLRAYRAEYLSQLRAPYDPLLIDLARARYTIALHAVREAEDNR